MMNPHGNIFVIERDNNLTVQEPYMTSEGAELASVFSEMVLFERVEPIIAKLFGNI